MNIREYAEKISDYSSQIRREMHMYPELSFEERRTSTRIKEELDKMGIKNRMVMETGIIAEIDGANTGKTVALRADIDALGIKEETGLEFASKNQGVMHACGHDVHIASLLTAAKILNDRKEAINGKVILIFQPGEEMVQGAPKMMEADDFMDHVDAIFGIHNLPEYDAGDVCVHDGGMMFAGERFTIEVEGVGGHGALPHSSIDALLVASQIVINTQAILGREIDPRDPAVVTICTFQSGLRHNIMADSATLTGTYRCYNKEVEDHLKEALVRMVESTAKTFRAKGRVIFDQYVPAVVNNPEIGKIIRQSANKIIQDEKILEVKPLTGSDDFAYFSNKVPGYYAFIGSGVEDKAKRVPIHSANFLIDEKAITVSASLYAQFAVDFLNQ